MIVSPRRLILCYYYSATCDQDETTTFMSQYTLYADKKFRHFFKSAYSVYADKKLSAYTLHADKNYPHIHYMRIKPTLYI